MSPIARTPRRYKRLKHHRAGHSPVAGRGRKTSVKAKQRPLVLVPFIVPRATRPTSNSVATGRAAGRSLSHSISASGLGLRRYFNQETCRSRARRPCIDPRVWILWPQALDRNG
jgi:hypothetical protein